MHKHVCYHLANFKDAQWLMHERAKFVSTVSTDCRNSCLAGRTGTRLNVGRSQPRWQEGISLAEEVLNNRNIALKGQNALTIGSRIRNALLHISSSAQRALNHFE